MQTLVGYVFAFLLGVLCGAVVSIIADGLDYTP